MTDKKEDNVHYLRTELTDQIKEVQIGIAEMVEALDQAYGASCELNKTTPEDILHFRRYMWTLFALQEQRLNAIIAKITEEKP